MEAAKELDLLITLLPLAVTVFIIALGVILLNQHFQKNLNRQKLKQEELKYLHQKELLISSIEVQEQERKRIAQDLHDELGAALSIARMHLLQLEQQCAGKAEEILPPVQNVRSLTESALASMRRISHELMPPQLEAFGLVKTLEAVATRANSANEINIQIIAPTNMIRLALLLELGLYRISMELINNTLKHALARQITIHLKLEHDFLIFLYTDDGNGLSEGNYVRGLGHKSIEARVSSMMGTFILDNDEKEGGFRTLIKIPIAS